MSLCVQEWISPESEWHRHCEKQAHKNATQGVSPPYPSAYGPTSDNQSSFADSCDRGLSHPYEARGPAQPTEKEDTGGELCRACFVPKNRRSKTNKNRKIAVSCITHLRNDCQDVEVLRSGSGVLSLLGPLCCPGWGFERICGRVVRVVHGREVRGMGLRKMTKPATGRLVDMRHCTFPLPAGETTNQCNEPSVLWPPARPATTRPGTTSTASGAW